MQIRLNSRDMPLDSSPPVCYTSVIKGLKGESGMANAWDYIMKRLIGSYPKQFTSWLLAGATFIRTLDNELKIQSLYSDALLEVVVHEKPALLHVEFQTY